MDRHIGLLPFNVTNKEVGLPTCYIVKEDLLFHLTYILYHSFYFFAKYF